MDLKAMWPGKAIFTDAFLRALPMPGGIIKPSAPPVVRRVRRGMNVFYTPGPLYHRKGQHGENWTNYMVRTVLAHKCTREAEEAHAASGVYAEKRLDFNWMFKNQFITRVQ